MQHPSSAAEAVDALIHGTVRGSRRAPPEVKADSDLGPQQRLGLLEQELKRALLQRQQLEDRVTGVEARADVTEKQLRADVAHVAEELASLFEALERAEEKNHVLTEHVRVLRVQVDDLSRRIAHQPIRRGWSTKLSFSFLTLR